MSFSTLTVGSQVFNETEPGKYYLSTTAFSDPDNYIKIRGGTKRNDGSYSAGLTRVHEKESGELMSTAVISVNIIADPDGLHSAADLVVLIGQIKDALTESIVSDMLRGRS
jgi:hypothetical protein